MGTRSSYIKGRPESPRKTNARILSGHRLADVLGVIAYPSLFNRKTRRIVFALWRKHCRALGVNMVAELRNLRGEIKLQSPETTQFRILRWAKAV